MDTFLEASAATYPRLPGSTRHGLHALLAFHSRKHRHTITLHPLDHNLHRWTPEDDATAAITIQQDLGNPEEYHITWNDLAPHPRASPTLQDVFATISAELQEPKAPQQPDDEMPQAPSRPTAQESLCKEPLTHPITTMDPPTTQKNRNPQRPESSSRHPFDNSPAALQWPTDPPKTVRKRADLTRSHAKATMQTPAEPPLRDPGQQATHPFFQPHAPPAPPPPIQSKRARPKRGAPAPNRARKDGRATTSQPPAPPPNLPPNPDQASSSSSLPPLPPAHPDQASSSSCLPRQPPAHPDQASSSSSVPPPAPPQPKAYPEFKKGAKVQQHFRNDHTGDWIWCEGTIQYHLRDLGPNNGVQIQVIWHRQKELDQGNSALHKPEGHTLELNSAQPNPAPHQREQGGQRHQIHRGTLP